MRPDQIQRMQELAERLADVVLEEADPSEWPGAGIPLASLSQQERGDRYWCKKNAAATFSLLERTNSVLSDIKDPNRNRSSEEEADLDAKIKAAEKEAEKRLSKIMSGAKKVTSGKT